MRHWVQLPEAVPVETPKGWGHAWFIIDRGIENDVQWFVVVTEGPYRGQFWIVDNPHVRACKNWTIGRGYADWLRRGEEGEAAPGVGNTDPGAAKEPNASCDSR
jgi:hypothetical protein